MTDKEKFYLATCDALAPLWERDASLSARDPETWQRARQIDDWLCQYREDPRVGEEQYARNCERLLAVYVGEIEEKRFVEVA